MASAPAGNEFTVASYNLERFFDDVNDPGIGEPVLTAAAFDNRLNKASLGIRNHLGAPDVLGVVEIENLSTLQALAARISADAIAAAQPDPEYDAYLVEGNDVGGIDVGFLVKTAEVSPGVPRVAVNAVVQENAGELFVNADSSTELLNDRPSLRLDAVVNDPNGETFPVTVIVNHLRSLIDVNSIAPGSNGWATAGERVRAKRLQQAESLANLVEARQTVDPSENIILVGDFNAYEFNDGLADSMNVIAGTPPPDNETAVPGDGIDLVTPDLDNLFDTPPPAERYSFIFDGQTQNIDHVLVNGALAAATVARRVEHPRINADFPAVDRNDPGTPRRLSDHDPVVGFFAVGAFSTADLAVTKVEAFDPVAAGANLGYTLTVTNNGPDPADASWSDTLPAGTTFVSLAAPGGWTCSTPAVGSGGTIDCAIDPLPVSSAVFTLVVHVDASVLDGTILSNTATLTSTATEANPGDESATELTAVFLPLTFADLQVTKVDTPDPVTPGTDLTYTITVTNAGPESAAQVSVLDTLPAGTTFVSLAAPAGWTCATPAVGSGGTVDCSLATFPVGNAVFTLVVDVAPSAVPGSEISNLAVAITASADPNPENEFGVALTAVGTAVADYSLVKTDGPDPVQAGADLTYTLTASNTGPSVAANAALSDPLPAGTTFVSLSAPAGWSCTTPAVGAGGVVSCGIPAFTPGSAVFTLVVQVGATVPGSTVLSNTATLGSSTPDATPGDTSSEATTTVISPAAVSGTKTVGGTLSQGGTVTYTVVLANGGPAAQGDNPGDEFTDVLPAGLTLTGATATSGTATATLATNTVTWNGVILAGQSVTLTIDATVNAPTGTTISNQGTIAYDADGFSTNEASALTDDPAVAGGADPTDFVVAQAFDPAIPTLDTVGLAVLALLLAMGGAWMLRRKGRV
jgi:uncharacterized repeat protein (TIGR01451 family)/fimbrial isopeptide formation D2 family protein